MTVTDCSISRRGENRVILIADSEKISEIINELQLLKKGDRADVLIVDEEAPASISIILGK